MTTTIIPRQDEIQQRIWKAQRRIKRLKRRGKWKPRMRFTYPDPIATPQIPLLRNDLSDDSVNPEQ